MSRKLEAVYDQFLKLLESGKKLTIDEIEKSVNFKKLSESEQHKLKDLLTKKIELLKKQSKLIKKSATGSGTVKSKRNKLAGGKSTLSEKSKKKLKKANRRKRKQMRKLKKMKEI